MKRFGKIFKGAGWLNILGMSVAFAAIYVILVQVNYELGYNRKINDADRIFLIATQGLGLGEGKLTALSPRALSAQMCSESPDIENSCVICQPEVTRVQIGEGNEINTFEDITVNRATAGIFDVFGIGLVAGSLDENPEMIFAVSESLAERLKISIGDVVRIKSQYNDDMQAEVVSAIFKDMPLNSQVGHTDIISCRGIAHENEGNWNQYNYITFLKLDNARTASSIEELGARIKQEHYEYTRDNYPICLVPLKDIYLHKYLPAIYDFFEKGSLNTVLTLIVVAVLILVVTLINYVNFFMAQIPARLRTVNTYKILGSSRQVLVMHFVLESGLLVFVSFIFAYIPLFVFKQLGYESFISTSLDLSGNLGMLGLTFLMALLITLVSSISPAMKITSYPMAMALKGTLNVSGRGNYFRYTLVAFQFVISISFLICSFFVMKQYRYMMEYDMGFDKGGLYSFNVANTYQLKSTEVLEEELLKCPDIEDVSWSYGPIVSHSGQTWGMILHNQQLTFRCIPVSYDFLRFIGIDIIEGRDFVPSDEQSGNGVFIFNKTARNLYGLTLQDDLDGDEIAGFCDDFHFRSLEFGIEPLAFYINSNYDYPKHHYIRTNKDVDYEDLSRQVNNAFRSASVDQTCNPGDVKLLSFDEELGRQYENERGLIKLISLFSIIAILISLLGIVGLLMFETAFRKKEVAVRRVQGATVREILELFNRKYIMILLVSFMIAVPVSWLLMDHYLKAFACRIPLSWWVFVVAMLVVLLITVLVVTLCTWSSANLNPAESLKDE